MRAQSFENLLVSIFKNKEVFFRLDITIYDHVREMPDNELLDILILLLPREISC